MANPKPPRILRELIKANPGLIVISSAHRWKIMKAGRMLAIYPFTPKREGLSLNTQAQLRRAGIVLPAGRKEDR